MEWSFFCFNRSSCKYDRYKFCLWLWKVVSFVAELSAWSDYRKQWYTARDIFLTRLLNCDKIHKCLRLKLYHIYIIWYSSNAMVWNKNAKRVAVPQCSVAKFYGNSITSIFAALCWYLCHVSNEILLWCIAIQQNFTIKTMCVSSYSAVLETQPLAQFIKKGCNGPEQKALPILFLPPAFFYGSRTNLARFHTHPPLP